MALQLASFRQIGLSVSKGFEWQGLDDATKRGLARSIKAGEQIVDSKWESAGETTNGWKYTFAGGHSGFDPALRAALAKYESAAQISDQFLYPNTSVDDKGEPLTGAHKYVLHFDVGKLPPVIVFWNWRCMPPTLVHYCSRSFCGPRGLNRKGVNMRLRILDSGHGFGKKALFALIRTVSRQPVLDVIKLVKYQSDFYGAPMSGVTHEAMRGPSTWSVGDRELMAAFVREGQSVRVLYEGAHGVAQGAYHRDGQRVPDLLFDFDTAAIEAPLRATLLMLRKLTREHAADANDMRAVLAAGASRQQIEDALAVCFSFNVIGRLAEAFAFLVPGPDAVEAGAKYLLARGYR